MGFPKLDCSMVKSLKEINDYVLPPYFQSSNSGFKVQLALHGKWRNLGGNGVNSSNF